MSAPNALVPIALLGFFPLVLGAFLHWHPRRAVLVSLFGGWLFLPTIDGVYDVPLLHTKAMFVPAVVLLASVALDGGRWLRFRPRLVDLPMALVCLVPAASSFANGFGAYDAGSGIFETSMSWGAPYLLGRVYFSEPRALLDLATAAVAAAVAYVPFCLWEIRMSPQLHGIVYGYQPTAFIQTVRFGGYRPSVFLIHGLMLALFMSCAALIAFWIWRTGARRELWGIPMGWVSAALVAMTLLCKSTGAIVLLAMGLAALEIAQRVRSAVPLLILLALPALYCAGRVSGWSGKPLVSASQELVNAERAGSLEFRIVNEDQLIAKALQHRWLGWGRWGGSRVYDESGKDISVTDGLWILLLGSTGIVGLVAFGVALAVPGVLLVRLCRSKRWGDPRVAPAAALAIAVALGSIDDLFNAVPSPMFPAIAGGLLGLYLAVKQARRRQPVLRRVQPFPSIASRQYRPRWVPLHGR
jgi:hypothetical protein